MPMGTEGQPSAYSISEFGPKENERLDRQASLWLHKELPTILETLPKAGRFVDLGCGTGLLADAVAQARPDTAVYGFDSDPPAVEQTRLRFGARPGRHCGVRRLEQGPPHGFDPADVAVLRMVLMHLSDPGSALAAARTWLKPGGVLHIFESDDRAIILEPETFRLPELFDLMQEVQKHRGGSRRLGMDLPALLDSAAWTIVGREQIVLDPLATAAAIPKVFLPVAEHYLGEAERLGLVRPEHLLSLTADLGRIREGGLTSAAIPLFHVWARRTVDVAP
jgi:SAM-dependent methyltransferase